MDRKNRDKLESLMLECGLIDKDCSNDEDESRTVFNMNNLDLTRMQASCEDITEENVIHPISNKKYVNQPTADIIRCINKDINSIPDITILNSEKNEDLFLNPETGLFEPVPQLITADLPTESRKRPVLNAETGTIEYESDDSVEFEMVTKDSTINQKPKGKKRKSLPELWKKNLAKQRKLKNHQMREIPLCRCECKNKIKISECKRIFERFINLNTHTEQNIYLQGCIKEEIPKRHRPRKRNQKPRRVFTYHLELINKSVQVCASAFLAIHGIKKDRLKRKVLQKHNDITDGRGRHNNHPCKANEENLSLVHKFITDLPAQVSHYSRTDNKHKKYLDADLSIAELHRRLIDTHPNLKEVISYSKFRQIFNYDFNIAFGTPRKDICNVCEKNKVNIMSAELENKTDLLKQLNIQKELHLRKADVFFKKLQKAEGDSDEHILNISFDFQKNLPLPVTNIQDEYYRRQLWLHNFGIHNINDNTACMYLFTENYCHKGPNEVITALNNYLQRYNNNQYKILKIFCDNCFSQNKNRYLFTYLDQLCTKGLFEEVVVIYPIPGHSMMPIDRDFALIEHKRLKKQTIHNPEYYVRLIQQSRVQNPFDVVFLEKSLNEDGSGITVKVKDFKDLYDNYVKPVAGISTCREVKFSKFNRPSLRESMSGSFKSFTLYKVGVSRAINRDPEDAYNRPLPLKPGKLKDILHLLQFVPDSEKHYFQDIISTIPNEEANIDYISEEERE